MLIGHFFLPIYRICYLVELENLAKNGNIYRSSASRMKLPAPRKRGETYTITVSYQKNDIIAPAIL